MLLFISAVILLLFYIVGSFFGMISVVLCIVFFMIGVAFAGMLYSIKTKNLLNTAWNRPPNIENTFLCKEIPDSVMYKTVPELLETVSKLIELLNTLQPYAVTNTDIQTQDIYKRAFNTSIIGIYAQIFLLKVFLDTQTVPTHKKQEYAAMWTSFVSNYQGNLLYDENSTV